MTNDYKTDKNKPPLLDALRPFAPALVALARMMDDMQHKHRLAGAKDPFSEWKQLPDAKRRMANGMTRHLIEHGPWTLNTDDALAGKDAHLHATHALFNLLGALTVHLEDNAKACCEAPDAAQEFLLTPDCHQRGHDGGPGRCTSWHTETQKLCTLYHGHDGQHSIAGDFPPYFPPPIHGPAGADWREPPQPGSCMNGVMHALNPYTGKCARCDQHMDRCGG